MKLQALSPMLTIWMVLAGCAGRQTVILPTEIWVPEGWSEISDETYGDSECPAVSGTYSEAATQWSSPGSNYKDIVYEYYGYFTVMPFNLSEENVPITSDVQFEDGEFAILQEHADQFLFLNKSLEGKVSEDVFSQAGGDFQCKDSRMVFPPEVVYGANEGGSFNHQYQGFLVVDEAGDLVLVRITGPYKSSILGISPKFEYDFLKFSRKRG